MRTKLITLLVVFVLLSTVAVTALGWFISRGIVRDAATERLISIRTDRADEIEHHFSVLSDELLLLSQDPTIVSAVQSFSDAFTILIGNAVSNEQRNRISTYYNSDFLPNLEVSLRRDLDAAEYIPQTGAGIYLQTQYIVNNEFEVGSKHLLDDAADGSDYSAIHNEYHPFLRSFIELFDYYDLFLIDPASRNIIYSVYKEVDFATNLSSGPYSESGLADVVDLVLNDPIPGEIQIADFSPYDPSFQAPAAFFATGVFEDEALVGVLVIQLPIDEIDAVMTSNQQWSERGMGETGESYLIGQDQLMRSTARLLVEDRAAYSAAIRDAGMPSETADRILNLGTSILLHEITTESAERALAGETDLVVTTNYRNAEVLSAFAPLQIEGVDWAIIAEIDTAEIDTPLEQQFAFFLATMGGLVAALLLLSIYMSNRFTRPIRRLALAAQNTDSDTLGLSSRILDSRDEVGQLATAINDQFNKIQAQQIAVDSVTRENERLMFSIVPSPIAARIKAGEHNIAEEVQDVTLMFAYLRGIHELAIRINDRKRTAELLNFLAEQLEKAGAELGVEREPTISNRFMAVCGLNDEEGDRIERMVRYALVTQRIMREFNQEFGSSLGLKIGIHNGPVLAAVLETDAFRFDLWGSTVEITNMLETSAPRDSIVVSHEVYLRTQHLYRFEQYEPINLEDGRKWRAWLLTPPDDDEESITDRFAYALAQAGRSRKLPSALKPRNRRTNKRFSHS